MERFNELLHEPLHKIKWVCYALPIMCMVNFHIFSIATCPIKYHTSTLSNSFSLLMFNVIALHLKMIIKIICAFLNHLLQLALEYKCSRWHVFNRKKCMKLSPTDFLIQFSTWLAIFGQIVFTYTFVHRIIKWLFMVSFWRTGSLMWVRLSTCW